MSNTNINFEPLSAEEVTKAVERRGPSRVPCVRTQWWGEGLEEQYGERLDELKRYPDDAVMPMITPVRYWDMGLSWDFNLNEGAHDARVVLDDWAKLDEFIEKLPDPEQDEQIDRLAEEGYVRQAQDEGRYLMFAHWRLFFERPWEIRGMENLMMDYYEAPDQVHRLHDALCKVYCGHIRKAARVLKPHAFWTSDDLGHQTQSMVSPQIFHDLIFPYYQRVGEVCRELGLHWWLHSCGNNTALMEDLIAAGVDVFHPVQKGTMDYRETMDRFGGRITFLAGVDVQHVLQEATPEEVRAEVREIIDTFDAPDGGCCIAAGNGIVSGTPFENIEAFLDEAARYGSQHRQLVGT